MNDTDAGRRAPIVLAGLALAWLAATLWSAHATLSGYPRDDLLALNAAALALPVVISASLVAAVALGLVAVRLVGPRLAGDRLPARLAIGAGAGLLLGLAVAGVLLAGYGTHSSLVVIAIAVAAVSLVGGALSGLRPDGIVGGAVAGALAWFLLGFVQGAFNDKLLDLFGAGESPASRVSATSRLLLTVALAGATLAGVVAYRHLRRRDTGLGWPAYLAAGAGPGLLLLLANLAALTAGMQLNTLAAATNAADRTALQLVRTAGINTALVVLFIGGIAAMIAFGRTLRGPFDEPAASSAAVEDTPVEDATVEDASAEAAAAQDAAAGDSPTPAEARQTS